MYIALPIVGLLVGLLIVSLGGGGGAIYVGVLTAFFNISPAVAASTSLATIIPTAAAGAFSHWKAGNVNLRLGLTMLSGGIIGSIVGSLFSDKLPQNLYNKVTGVIMVLLSIQMIISFLRKKKSKNNEQNENSQEIGIKKSDYIRAVLFGILGGIMSGLVGISGGGPIVAGLAILGRSSLESVGTSVLAILGISITGFSMHLGLGSVDWKLVGLLAVGTVSGGILGPLLLKRIDKNKLEKVLQPVLFTMIAAMSVLLFFK